MEKAKRANELTLRVALRCSHCGHPLEVFMSEPDPDDKRDMKLCFEPLLKKWTHMGIVPISVDPCTNCCAVDPAKDQYSEKTS